MSDPAVPPREEAIAQMRAYQDALERALAQGAGPFDRLFEHPPGPIAAHEIDVNKLLTRVNGVELRLLGYRADQMVGRPVWEFIVMQEVSKRAIERKLAETGEIKPFVRTYVRADGSPLPMLIVDRRRRDTRGEIVGMRTVMMQTSAAL